MERFRHGGDIYRETPPEGEWLDFSANINPLGLSERVRECLAHHLDQVVHYPDPEAGELKDAIAFHYHLPRGEILLGNGAAELLYLFFGVMRFSRVLLPQPSFSDYERAALAAGSRVEYIFTDPGEGFRLPLDKIRPLAATADCIVLGNPNNPTGALLQTEELAEWVQKVGRKSWVLVDESFMDFREDAESCTVRHLVKECPRLFVIQSMTKFFALPGLRLGFGVATEEVARRMEGAKDVWNVNLLAQKAGVVALSDVGYQERTLRWMGRERPWMEDALAAIPGMRVFSPSVNFLLADVRDTGKDGARILSEMKKRGILLRDCSNYPSLDGNYLRMAIRSHKENLRLLDAWEEIMGN